MANWLEYCLKSEREQDENPPPFVIRLRQLKAEREASSYTGESARGSDTAGGVAW